MPIARLIAGRTDRGRRATRTFAESLRLISYHLTPFIPASVAQITRQLGLDPAADASPYHEATQWDRFLPGTRVAPAQPIFPKLGISDGQG